LLQYKTVNVPVQYRIEGCSASGIADSIEAGVRSAALTPGERMPTVRGLARRLHVSPTTVAAAYQRLRRRGVLAGEGRRGTRVTRRPPLPVSSLTPVHARLRNLADGNPDPRLLPQLPAPLRERRPRLYGEGVQLPQLVDLARRQLTRDGIDGDLAVVSGGLDGIERVLLAHLVPGDRVAVEDPGFSGVFDLLLALGLVAEPVPVDDSGPLPADLERVLAVGAAALVVTPRAQNPTGAALDEKRRRELRAVLDRHPNTLVIEDDHAGPVAGTETVTLCPRPGRWAVIRSVSKSLGPDLRLAVLAGDPETVARVEGRQRLGMGWVSHVLQHAVAALWSDPRATRRFASAARTYAERRQALIGALARRGLAAHGRSGLNVWIPVAEEAGALTVLAERGWALRAGEAYRIRSAPGLRATVATLRPGEAEHLADDLAAAVRPSRRGSAIR
jgi:DNA-binding transcriptional MocR family regulator